ncbi:DUF4351 domain-containing protein [Romeria aff. gracilis LEGE 07310]|uniref:DUF4351 domain-containing protein n=1 Tax=Vasconcelosia minhoensis LEGE 07310 TaxID=915328 RepID=A0A8J7AZ45_9CYAN|nr:DUF4351 domain-containing protein [Romeria aff. gracilis LEGE 07310]
MTDHDRLFKELLSTFFVEFLELFLPQVANAIDRDSIAFQPQEYFADLTTGETRIIDLLAAVRLAGQDVGFLIHVEAQASSQADFAQRMFFYFARLHQKFRQRIYPVVVFSFDQPYRPEPHQYSVAFDDLKVVEFNFRAIQLNRLRWRDFLQQRNPIAAALMAKMRIAPEERPRVKLECLRLLATLRLDPARTQLISGFVDTYLRLSQPEEQVFQAAIDRIEPAEREGIMEIVTSWMERGIEQGIERGIERGIEQGIEQGIERERSLIFRLLARKLGEVPEAARSQINQLPITQLETLGEALLDFSTHSDLESWLAEQER